MAERRADRGRQDGCRVPERDAILGAALGEAEKSVAAIASGVAAGSGTDLAAPQLGRDVFARGRPETPGIAIAGAPPPDIVGLPWASLALFDPIRQTLYRPLDLYDGAEACERILHRIAEMPEGGRFEQFLPDVSEPAANKRRQAWRRLSQVTYASWWYGLLGRPSRSAACDTQEWRG